jgi:hypothetical protein
MSIPNVNQITTDLRMMGDQQLQQYAAMHKNDPYILPMAIAESNSRKALRAAKQAQDGGQPQGKVADQAIASMNAPPPQMVPQGMPPQMAPQGGPQMAQQQLPEQQGIGALPVKNMQNMADGGIAGYADGGEFNYAGGGDPVVMMAEGGIAGYSGEGESLVRTTSGGKDWFLDVPDTVQDPNVEWYRTMPNPMAGLAGKKFASKDEAVAAYDRANAMPLKERTPASQMMYNPPAATPTPGTAATDKQPPPPPNLRPAGPSTPAAPAAPEKSAAARLMDVQKEVGAGDRTAIDAKQNLLEKSMLSGATEEQTNLEKDIAARPKYGEAKEARLAEREAGLGKEKDTLVGLAALETALGLISTPGPFMNALGTSAQKGLKTYGEGIAKLKLAKEKIDDSRDQIDEFRRTESNMTAKERRDAANNINRTKIAIEQLGVAGLEKAYGLKAAEATTVFNAATQEGLTKQEIQGRKDVALIGERGNMARAAMPSGEMRTAMMLGSGKTDQEKLESGMIKYKELMGDKQGTQMLKLFLEENGRREKNMEPPLSLEQFRRTSAAFFAPPAPVDTNKVDRS